MTTKTDDTNPAPAAEVTTAMLAGQTGKRFWRSLDEWADTEEFRDLIGRQFPSRIEELIDPVTRRTFLKVMGASLAFAGVSGCAPSQPTEKIFPYASSVPAGMVPGRAMYFATAIPFGGYGTGVLVESNMGRPTKIEGNALHPASLGAADTFTQASVLSLYDPDRSQTVMQNGRVSSWDAFLKNIQDERMRHRANGGAGLRFLTGTVTSPTLTAQMRLLGTADHFPNARWYQYEPVSHGGSRVGSRNALGGDFDAVYAFDKATVVLSLDSNFLIDGPGHLVYAKQFTGRRRLTDGQRELNRLYMVESSPSLTGANADNRLRVRPSRIEAIARAIATGVGVNAPSTNDDAARPFVNAVVKDLLANRGACVVVAGDYQPASVHELAHAMNQALGAVGATVSYVLTAATNPVDHMSSILELANEIYDGKVDTLVMLGVNPVYDAPIDAMFRENIDKVRLRVHLGQYRDETALLSHWHVPEAHYLESWGDVRAFDGTPSILQPLIAPLYDGRSGYEVLAGILGQGSRNAHDVVREYWQSQVPATTPDAFDVFWRTALNDGKFAMPAPQPFGAVPAAPAPPAPRQVDVNRFAATTAAPAADGLEIAFRPDPCVWDGQFSNNGWLQELPKPLTKLTWDNAAIMNIRDAERAGVSDEDVVKLTFNGRSVTAPVRVLAGQPEGCVTVHLGFGRDRAGRVGNGVGFNAYALRSTDSAWFGTGLRVESTGDQHPLAVTEHHNMISTGTAKREAGSLGDHYSRFNEKLGQGPGFVDGERGRELVKTATLEEYLADPDTFQTKHEQKSSPMGGGHGEGPQEAEHAGEPGHGEPHTGDGGSGPAAIDSLIPGDTNESILPESFQYHNNRWAMSIDTQACLGCNACVVACQSENNIPVIGKAQVLMNRQMHRLRIDTYFEGPVEDPNTYFQPVPCMQCENAPCEIVCPVGATIHSEEGLNDMVYNRCVGTRYCSNNCPYKVRRYNFIKYSDQSPLAQLRANPNVTIRARGVMEKCTYCVQRIWKARITAEKENRQVREGEIKTACEQTCATGAIVFGNLNDPNSKVVQLKRTKLMYGLLAELNTRPRTTYLARVTNPSPDLNKA